MVVGSSKDLLDLHIFGTPELTSSTSLAKVSENLTNLVQILFVSSSFVLTCDLGRTGRDKHILGCFWLRTNLLLETWQEKWFLELGVSDKLWISARTESFPGWA